MTARIVLCTFLILIIAAVSAPVGAAAVTSAPATNDLRTPAGRAITALLSDHPDRAIAMLPGDFEHRIGYRPVLIDGIPANPDGGCSSPVPLPGRFEPLCKTHDLGYDLLRYAGLTGQPLGGWARKGLDAMLVRRMRAVCHDPLCRQSAELAEIGLRFNTWRQDSGVPVAETPVDLVTTTAGRIALAATGWVR